MPDSFENACVNSRNQGPDNAIRIFLGKQRLFDEGHLAGMVEIMLRHSGNQMIGAVRAARRYIIQMPVAQPLGGFFQGDHGSSHSLQCLLPGGLARVFDRRPAQRFRFFRKRGSIERSRGKLVPASDVKHEFPDIVRLRSDAQLCLLRGYAVENILQRGTVSCLSKAGTAELIG